MTITSKSALAAELAISKARVSQYVNAGMPVRSDGKLNREEALNWIAQNQLSQTYENKGVVRARSLAKRQTQRSRPGYELNRELDVAQQLAGRAGEAIVRAALKLGCSMEVAYSLSLLVEGDLDDLATEVLIGLGHDDGLRVISPLELAGRRFVPDYHALASEGGSVFDEAACDRFYDKIVFPRLAAPPGSPAALAARTEG